MYADFLKATLATRTVLYMGFSFTDHYLNEVCPPPCSTGTSLRDFVCGYGSDGYGVAANLSPGVGFR